MKRSSLTPAAALALALGSPAAAERGSDGDLSILYWQAPSTLNPYLSAGTKDVEAASLTLEPLARYNELGEIVPWLVDEVPTVANGGVAADLRSITWRLSDGLLWSDGSPVTAADVAFTARYCLDPATGCAQANSFADVTEVRVEDERAVTVVFSRPKPFPYGPFVGDQSPILQKAPQFEDCVGARAAACTRQNFAPVGTGAFRVLEFHANDVALYEANPHFREPDKPAFATVRLKGGGDAGSAARAVLQTGEFDYAWNLQIEPELLAEMEAEGSGRVVNAFGPSVEGIMLNMTDPSPAHGAARSTAQAGPHPFLTDPRVARALSMAIDRQTIVDIGYGAAGRPACNMLQAPPRFASTANDWCLEQDIDGARRLLDDAGWLPGPDGIRRKDGVRLSGLMVTTVNSVRQATQALVKQWWREIGVELELKAVPGSVFFGGDQASPDTYQKFYADMAMFAILFDGVDPEKTLSQWRCAGIPSPENNWSGRNTSRFCDERYDRLVDELSRAADPQRREALAKRMNDMMVQAGVAIPLVHRGTVSAHGASLEGVRINPWDSELWNVADWSRAP